MFPILGWPPDYRPTPKTAETDPKPPSQALIALSRAALRRLISPQNRRHAWWLRRGGFGPVKAVVDGAAGRPMNGGCCVFHRLSPCFGLCSRRPEHAVSLEAGGKA